MVGMKWSRVAGITFETKLGGLGIENKTDSPNQNLDFGFIGLLMGNHNIAKDIKCQHDMIKAYHDNFSLL